ncbi:MAG: O-antigen ligase family protein [Patescibacteria group bacterium]
MIITNKRDSWFWNTTEYALSIFIILFPFITYKVFLYTGTSVRSTALILLATILGIAFCISLFKKGTSLSFPKSPVFLAIGLYIVFVIISAFQGLNPATSFWSVATRTTGIWYLINLGFIIYILWGLFSDRARQKKLILVTILSTAFFSFLTLWSSDGLNIFFKNFGNDGFTFGNSTFAGMYIFGAFLLSIYYLLQSEKKKWWMYALPIIIIANPYILGSHFLGEARSSSLAVFLSVVGLLALWGISKIKDPKKKTVTSYSVFGLIILGIALSTFSLFSDDGYLRKAYLSQATQARPLVWDMSEKVIGQKPYFGWGIDNFERVFENNYDNRLLQDEYGGEPWFDRAHNVFIDQTVDNGFVGLSFYLLIYITIALCLIHVTLKSLNKNDRTLASIILVYLPLHILELQTAFDTSISYVMIALLIALSAVLYDRTREQITKKDNEWNLPVAAKYIVSGLILIFFFWSLFWGLVPFVRTQLANGYIRTVGSAEMRMPVYERLFATPVDKHAFLWRTVTDFQRGISQNPKVLLDKPLTENLKKEILLFEEEYKDYVAKNPEHFRAKLNLADTLIYERLFGINHLQEAQDILDSAIAQVPQAPQPYWMKAVGYVYMKKFDLAREYAQKGLALNPDIKGSQDIVKYVDTSIKNFPEIDLYFFRQI